MQAKIIFQLLSSCINTVCDFYAFKEEQRTANLFLVKTCFFFPLFTPDCMELNSELNTDTRKSSRWCARLIKHLCTRGSAVALSPTTTAAPGRRFHCLIEHFFSSANPISSAAVRIYVSAGVGQPRRRTSRAAKSTTQLRGSATLMKRGTCRAVTG